MSSPLFRTVIRRRRCLRKCLKGYRLVAATRRSVDNRAPEGAWNTTPAFPGADPGAVDSDVLAQGTAVGPQVEHLPDTEHAASVTNCSTIASISDPSSKTHKSLIVPKPNREQAERLRRAMRGAGIKTVSELARRVGARTASTCHHHVNGRRRITPAMAVRYATVLGVDGWWLLSGEHAEPDLTPTETQRVRELLRRLPVSDHSTAG